MRKLSEDTLIPLGGAAAFLAIVVSGSFYVATIQAQTSSHGEGIQEIKQQLAVQDATIRTNNEVCTRSVIAIEKAIIKMQGDLESLRRTSGTSGQ